MRFRGIRISDGRGEVLGPTLRDILLEMEEEVSLHWCLLFIDGTPAKGQGEFLENYRPQVNASPNGIIVSWQELLTLSDKFFQMFETIILGCKKQETLHRYQDDQEMYNSCDVVIELVDCAFWEVYAKKPKIIRRLQSKFKEIELLP